MHVERPGRKVGRAIPDFLEQIGPRKWLVRVFEEQLGQCELLVAQIDTFVAERHGTREAIELEVIDFDNPADGFRGSPPQHRIHARLDDRLRFRLHDVIVGAAVQRPGHVVLVGSARHHDDAREAGCDGTKIRQQIEARRVRKIPTRNTRSNVFLRCAAAALAVWKHVTLEAGF